MKKIQMNTVVVVFVLLLSMVSKATHNRSGEILYKRLPPFTNSNYTYSITVVKYFDDGSTVADRCADTVYFGDGSKGIAPRTNGVAGSCCASTSSCGVIISAAIGYRVKMCLFSIVHTYPGPGSYVIRSSDPNRTAGISNIPNSGGVPFYIEAVMNLTPGLGENTSPILSRPPIDRGITNNCFYHNPCAYDLDGDSLSFELVACKDQSGQGIAGFSIPPSSSGGSFSMNPENGLITWCNPLLQGTYQIAFLVKEWRRTGCSGIIQQIGYVERDMEVIVVAYSGTVGVATSLFMDDCVNAGSLLNKYILFTYSGAATAVTQQLYGYTQDANNSPIATITTSYGITPLAANITWQTNCQYIQRHAQRLFIVYTLTFTPVPYSFYEQLAMQVLPAPPRNTKVTADTNKVTVQWLAPQSCTANITGYKIYRKLFVPNYWNHFICETGAPPGSGFSLLGITNATANSYVDYDMSGVFPGNEAHYLVTALMNDCSESYADSAKKITFILGLNENKLENSVKVFPNPFNDNVEIQFKGSDYSTMETALYSIDGKILREQSYQHIQNEILIDTRDLSAGVYFLKLKSKDESANFKLIKE